MPSETVKREHAEPDEEDFPLECPCCVRQEQPAYQVLLDFDTVLANEIRRANKIENV